MAVGDVDSLDSKWIDVFRFYDPVQSVAARMYEDPDYEVRGRLVYPGEIIVESSFVEGRVRLCLSVRDLKEWSSCLQELENEEPVAWPTEERTARVEVVPDDPLVVTVVDSPSSQVSVRVPVDVDLDECLVENRELLKGAFARLRR
ncbi:hypothetical protein HNR23_000493 [Nocardiopsis mwathae]|uniref:Uncharacterized protein n=1 Tax=Nocardiopsis mwathae TaxID=1472723 RepID=A0A7X0D3Q3_9ACTN|nr:hypothetical protein [Nocardiopsis mwathae]